MSTIVERYSTALAGAARERSASDRVEEDAQGLLALFSGSEELSAFIANPFLLPEQKAGVFGALCEGKVHAVTMSFLRLLCTRRRDRFVADILRAFIVLREKERGVVTAEVRSASPLSTEQEARLRQKLSRYSGQQVRLETEVDPGLRAGFIVRLGDRVFDGSLDSMLNRIRRRLTA